MVEELLHFVMPFVGMLDEGKLNILLNLEGVSYVDEGALAEIVASHTATEAVGGQLKLLNLSERAFGDALMITKLLTVFQVYDNEKEAVVSFVRGGSRPSQSMEPTASSPCV